MIIFLSLVVLALCVIVYILNKKIERYKNNNLQSMLEFIDMLSQINKQTSEAIINNKKEIKDLKSKKEE